jgi:hypothetical protein
MFGDRGVCGRFGVIDELPPARSLHGPFRSEMDPDWITARDADAAKMMRDIRRHSDWFNR